MKDESNIELIYQKEQKMKKIFNVQYEKNFYLGEYKERVIVALTDDQLIEDDLYAEVLNAMKDNRATLLKMKRSIGLKYLKPYIKEAEKIGFRYELIDGLSYSGNIALVIVADHAIDSEESSIIIRDSDQDFLDVGLGNEFSKNVGKKICSKCFKIIEEKLPNYSDKFKHLNIIDKLFGIECPICKYKKQVKKVK